MRAVGPFEPDSRSDQSPVPEQPSSSSMDGDSNFRDEERGLSQQVPLSVRSSNGQSSTPVREGTELLPTSLASVTGGFIRKKASQLMDAVSLSSHKASDAVVAPRLAALVESYASSDIAARIKQEIEEVKARRVENGNGHGNVEELRDIEVESSLLRGRNRASWGMQFRILSGRAFKNLYRDPALLAAHYISSIALACKFKFISALA